MHDCTSYKPTIQNINGSFLVTLQTEQKERIIATNPINPAKKSRFPFLQFALVYAKPIRFGQRRYSKYDLSSPTTNRNAKLYSHESTWRGWKTRGLAHRFPLRKPSLRRSSSLNHLTESSPRSTTRPLRLPVCVVSLFTPSIPPTKHQLSFNRNGENNRARFISSEQVAWSARGFKW